MSRAICIDTNCKNELTILKIENEVSKFLQEDFNIKENRFDVFFLKPIEEKINTEMLNKYIDFLKTTSLNGAKKVGIIIDFDLLSVQNQNKLLIYIEQENDNILQIFSTKNLKYIIPTIKSRTNIITLKDDYYQNLTSDQQTQVLYTKIIENGIELETYNLNKEFLDSLFMRINNKEYSKAFILYTIKVKNYDSILFAIIFKMLLNSLVDNYVLAKKVLKLEKQLNANSNKKLQMDNIFVTIMEGTTWN